MNPRQFEPRSRASCTRAKANGQGLLALYRRKGPSYQRLQIGIIPRTGGQIQPVTRDTNGYSALTLSADGKTAATVQVRVNRSLSLLPGSGNQGNAAIQTLSAQDVDSATWAADGKLLVSDAQGVRRMNADGPTPGPTIIDHGAWSDDNRQIAYEALTSQNDWNVYTQKIDGGPPVLVKAKGRNTYPTLSPDGTIVALHAEGGGISLYRAGTSRPAEVKGALASESPIRFVEGGRSLLVTDNGGKEVILTVIDLASGRRKQWKRWSLSAQRNAKTIVVTPDLKYYAYFSPRYSSDLYLVENLR